MTLGDPINMICGDRTGPLLPIAPHLRATDARRGRPAPGYECPLYSRVAGKYPVFTGMIPLADALAAKIAGEA